MSITAITTLEAINKRLVRVDNMIVKKTKRNDFETLESLNEEKKLIEALSDFYVILIQKNFIKENK
jgi:hypothetical protein